MQGFTKILSDSKCGSDKMAIALVGARDASAELLQATRSAADEQWKLLEKVLLPCHDLHAHVSQRK